MRRREVPRLSIALRAAVNHRGKQRKIIHASEDDPAYENLLKKRRQRENERYVANLGRNWINFRFHETAFLPQVLSVYAFPFRKSGKFTFREFTDAIARNSFVDQDEAQRLAANVKAIAVNISGGNESVMADEAFSFLIKLFRGKDVASMADLDSLRSAFGDVDRQFSREACMVRYSNESMFFSNVFRVRECSWFELHRLQMRFSFFTRYRFPNTNRQWKWDSSISCHKKECSVTL